MCGIHGTFGGGSENIVNVIADGLVAASLRGQHSTGVAIIDDKGRILRSRENFCAGEYVKRKGLFLRSNIRKDTVAVLGHARHATRGGHTDANAHPFQFGSSFVGLHNGTISNFRSFNKGRHVTGDTDSEWILSVLAEEEDPMKVLPYLEGTYVLVWWKNGLLHMARNGSERHRLIFAKEKDEERIHFSSEKMMLPLVMKRNGHEIEKYYELPPKQLYTFTATADGWRMPTKPEEYEAKKLERITPLQSYRPAANLRGVREKGKDTIRKEEGESIPWYAKTRTTYSGFKGQGRGSQELDEKRGVRSTDSHGESGFFQGPGFNIPFLEGLYVLQEEGCHYCGETIDPGEDDFIFEGTPGNLKVYGNSCCGAAHFVAIWGEDWVNHEDFQKEKVA